MKKLIPLTEECKDAVNEEQVLSEEIDQLNTDLDEEAERHISKKYPIAVQKINEYPLTIAETHELCERMREGDSSAVPELINSVSRSEQQALQAFTEWQIEAENDQLRIVRAKDIDEKSKAWFEQQAVSKRKRQAMQMVMKTFRQVQNLRITIGNQLFAWGRMHILNLEPSAKEITGSQADKILKEIKDDYNRVTRGMLTKILRNGGHIDGSNLDPYILVLADLFILLEDEEKRMGKHIEALCRDFEIYNRFFKPVPGIGPLTAGSLISLLDVTQANYASSFVKYCGLDVVKIVDEQTGEIRFEGRGKKKSHLVERTYIDKDGKEQRKLSITFNPIAKCTMFNLASSFIKGRKSVDRNKPLDTWVGHTVPVYGDIYDDYKTRKTIENESRNLNRSKNHIDAMAKRYLEKILLQELHPIWCYLLGVYEKIRLPYHIAKMDGFEYHPCFTPLRDIVFNHAVRDREVIKTMQEREEKLRGLGFVKPF